MSQNRSEADVYYIPPNFIEGGTLFGGMLKLRNTIEAGILGLAVGLPILRLPLSLTTRIILLCLTAMPLALAAVIGVSGESLSSFALNFLRFLRNRRVIGGEEPTRESEQKKGKRREKKPRRTKPDRKGIPEEFEVAMEQPRPLEDYEDFPEEFGEVAPRRNAPEKVAEEIPEEFSVEDYPAAKTAKCERRRKKRQK